MSFDLTARELKATVSLSPEDRLRYFVEKVILTGQIWTLAEEEALLVLGSEEHAQFVAVWPHPDYALSWFEDSGIEEADLVAMNVDDWVGGTLEELEEAEISIDAFPTADQDGRFVTALELLNLLAASGPVGG
jgi:hypothetical protein